MKIVYSEHFLFRNKLRNIEAELAESIYANADERYLDIDTGMFIAVKRVEFRDKERDVGIVYKEKNDEIIFVTVHPLKEGQKENRIRSGRWKPL